MTKTVQSVSEFISLLPDLRSAVELDGATLNAWYRGHGDDTWELTPTLFRCEVPPDREREMLRDFKIHLGTERQFAPNNDIDWIFIAQHHGLPTRMLDWTENPLVALFFAVERYDHPKDGKLFALNAWSLNTDVAFSPKHKAFDQADVVGLQTVPTTDHRFFKKYVIDLVGTNVPRTPEAVFPMAFRPQSPFKRSMAQSGVFSIHGTEMRSLEKYASQGLMIESLTIPHKAKHKIFCELFRIGISHGFLFGDANSIAQSIRFRYSKAYL
jgi:hypothetical protein